MNEKVDSPFEYQTSFAKLSWASLAQYQNLSANQHQIECSYSNSRNGLAKAAPMNQTRQNHHRH